ncbi:MAG: asparaginase [Pseudomonas balearica]|nr:asparaginase [Stutzerimonas balearica]
MPAPVPFAEIIRSDFVEGHHYGSAVALAADGTVGWSLGDVDSPILPRSSTKPVQALAMLILGLDLPPDLLALACASHSGEAIHQEGVRRILATVGLDESALGNIEDYPFGVEAREEALRRNQPKTRLAMNCSGKHAAMLATCVTAGWPLEGYLDPEHPLQVGIQEVLEACTGEAAYVTVDGCGAPALSTSLTGLARAFSTIAAAVDGPAAQVAAAMRAHPEYVSGTTRDEVALHRAVPGLIGKLGAEAVYAVALPDGRAWALKVDDGGDRARPVVMAAALLRDGVGGLPGVDTDAVRATGEASILGGGRRVGQIRALL